MKFEKTLDRAFPPDQCESEELTDIIYEEVEGPIVACEEFNRLAKAYRDDAPFLALKVLQTGKLPKGATLSIGTRDRLRKLI